MAMGAKFKLYDAECDAVKNYDWPITNEGNSLESLHDDISVSGWSSWETGFLNDKIPQRPQRNCGQCLSFPAFWFKQFLEKMVSSRVLLAVNLDIYPIEWIVDFNEGWW